MTALIAWPTSIPRWKEVDNQVAAPAETRTPNLHRANKNRSSKSADGRVATVVATRHREKNRVQRKNNRILLTPTGLLMEGLYTNYGSMHYEKAPRIRRVEAVMGAASAPLRCAGASLRYGGARE